MHDFLEVFLQLVTFFGLPFKGCYLPGNKLVDTCFELFMALESILFPHELGCKAFQFVVVLLKSVDFPMTTGNLLDEVVAPCFKFALFIIYVH